MKKTLFLIVVAAAFCACNKVAIEQDAPQTPVEDRTPINIGFDVMTKVSDTSFDHGDQVGVYVVKEDDWFDNDNHYNNNCLTYDYYSGSWSQSETMYWYDKHTRATFYCYYPYNYDVWDVNNHVFEVVTDQSSESNYKASDFVWGKEEYVSPTSNTVNISTKHIMSNVEIVLRPGKGFTEDSFANTSKEVSICNVRYQAYIDLENGNVNSDEFYYNKTEIRTLNVENDTYYHNYRYRAVIVPQYADYGELIKVTIDGDNYILKGSYNFESGRKHTVTVTVNKTGNGVNVGVGDWEDGDDFFGDAE